MELKRGHIVLETSTDTILLIGVNFLAEAYQARKENSQDCRFFQ